MNLKSKIIVCLLGFWFFALPAWGAELSLSAKKNTFQPGEKFLVSIFLNTNDDSINAIEGKVVFPEELLVLKEIWDGDSLITFWLERPKANGNEIVFSGIIPGGYFDKKGLVLSLVFQARQEGQGEIALNNAKVLLNDGQGATAKLSLINLPFIIAKQTETEKEAVIEIKDIDSPEIFTPMVAQDQTMFNGQYFLVFATQDKGSGIDYYEVQEGWGRFIRAVSPYHLLNQRLDWEITVRAVDKAGNERIAVLPAVHPWPWYQKIIFCGIVIIVISLLYFIGGIIWRKHQKQKRRQ